MKRSKFSLSHTKLFSGNMGYIYPATWMEVLPGDSFQQATSLLLRCSPLLTPVMHPVRVRIHHWYVPLRLIWGEFEDFITGGPNGTSAPTFPHFNISAAGGFPIGSLGDHLGIPTAVPGNVTPYMVSALPFRAYSLIWNENYRDQDLQTEVGVGTGSGLDGTTNVLLQRAAWEKDYYTSARPWEQKGPAVTIPLGSTAPVSGLGISNTAAAAATLGGATVFQASGTMPAGPAANIGDGSHLLQVQMQSNAGR